MNNSIPWVEKYRPKHFENIVLDPLNKNILQNIISTSLFPNLLLYGPPGTGKTTTIINLINSYQNILNEKSNGLIIHLNASDERGIDIIRNHISQFVESKPLFNKGMKFVILDEVDYMTKTAQLALKNLLQKYSNTVRFCLICNYISRIDEGLQNEFIKLRFNQLPQTEIIVFLNQIVKAEKLDLSIESIELIQKLFNSDIRSMINFMQSNQNLKNKIYIISDNIWENLFILIQSKETLDNIKTFTDIISINYNINKKNLIKEFFNYLIRKKENILKCDILNFMENIIHSEESINIDFCLFCLEEFIPKDE